MSAPLPEFLLVGLSDLLAAHLGLHYPRERWADLERGIAAAASRLGLPHGEAFARRLLAAPLTHREIEGLAADLTVGETYFFREKQGLEALERHVLPQLLRARAGAKRKLRIWSAGCCTGEEPYSIAMLLDRLLPGEDEWSVTVLATDVNPVFLRAAAQAEYGEWSFRETPGWMRERYFQRGHGGRFRLRDSIRTRVTFASLNLADDSYPAPVGEAGAMDVILCRNVLMYFTAERARAAVDKFHRALADDGCLVVSPAETSTSLFARFTPVHFDGAILYRKSADAEMPQCEVPRAAPTAAPAPDWFRDLPPLPEPAAAVAPPSPAAGQIPKPLTPTAPPAPDLDRLRQNARDCANRGRLAEAAEWCRQAIAADRLDAASHYLLGTIEQSQARTDEAAQSFSRALYLAPDFALAHFALGHLRQSQGRGREAWRHFDNAVASLRALPPDEIVAEAGGLTAGVLAEIVNSLRAGLPPVAPGAVATMTT